MSQFTLRFRGSAMWDVLKDGERIGAVWFGAGSYWYTVKGFSDYPTGHAPSNQAEMTIDKLAKRVLREYETLQELVA